MNYRVNQNFPPKGSQNAQVPPTMENQKSLLNDMTAMSLNSKACMAGQTIISPSPNVIFQNQQNGIIQTPSPNITNQGQIYPTMNAPQKNLSSNNGMTGMGILTQKTSAENNNSVFYQNDYIQMQQRENINDQQKQEYIPSQPLKSPHCFTQNQQGFIQNQQGFPQNQQNQRQRFSQQLQYNQSPINYSAQAGIPSVQKAQIGGPLPNMYSPASLSQAATGQRRLDPDQMPNPIQVMVENQKNSGGAFVTNQAGLLPPLATTRFVTQDQGNSSPRYIRRCYKQPPTLDAYCLELIQCIKANHEVSSVGRCS